MRTHYIKKAFIAIALFFFSTNILAQEVKLIKVTEKNHITDIKSLYIKEPFLNEIISVNGAYGYVVKDNDGYGYLLLNSSKLSVGVTITTNKNPNANDKPYLVGYLEAEGKKIPMIVLANSLEQLKRSGY